MEASALLQDEEECREETVGWGDAKRIFNGSVQKPQEEFQERLEANTCRGRKRNPRESQLAINTLRANRSSVSWTVNYKQWLKPQLEKYRLWGPEERTRLKLKILSV